MRIDVNWLIILGLSWGYFLLSYAGFLLKGVIYASILVILEIINLCAIIFMKGTLTFSIIISTLR